MARMCFTSLQTIMMVSALLSTELLLDTYQGFVSFFLDQDTLHGKNSRGTVIF